MNKVLSAVCIGFFYSFTAPVLAQTEDHFYSKEVCEQSTQKPCVPILCDYIPPGKTIKEVCGEDFKDNQWMPMDQSIFSSSSVRENFNVKESFINPDPDLLHFAKTACETAKPGQQCRKIDRCTEDRFCSHDWEPIGGLAQKAYTTKDLCECATESVCMYTSCPYVSTDVEEYEKICGIGFTPGWQKAPSFYNKPMFNSCSTGVFVITTDKGERVILQDVQPNAWYTQAIELVVRTGIASGYTDQQGQPIHRFGVEDPVTGGQIAKMALLAANRDIFSGSPRNVSAQMDWSALYIFTAESLNFTVYDVSFDVTKAMSRGDVIQTMLEAFQIPLLSDEANPYRDLADSHPRTLAILTATKLGIISGDTDANGKLLGTVRPDSQINRAEVSKILASLLSLNLRNP